LQAVQRAADFLNEQVRQQEPIYGVSTGFGSNADKLLGAHRLRAATAAGDGEVAHESLLDELQHNLVVTHSGLRRRALPRDRGARDARDPHQLP
jgi:histidine ammonia-lyase